MLKRELDKLKKDIDYIISSYDKWAFSTPENESMLEGSEFDFAKPPAFQILIETKLSPFKEEWITVGQAFVARVRDLSGKSVPFIFTAWHCVESSAAQVRLVGPLGQVEVSSFNFKQIPGIDVGYFQAQSQVLGKLGVSVARVEPLLSGTPVVVAGLGRMSHGKLSHSENVGLVWFNGSTCRGFSGAPYHTGKVVYGIHTAASTNRRINFGVSMDFATMLLRKHVFGNQEDSDEYYYHEIMEQHKAGTLQWAYSNPNDRDTVNFRDTRGRYHQMDADDFDAFVIKHKIPSRNYFREGGELQSAKVLATSATQTTWTDFEDRVDCGSSLPIYEVVNEPVIQQAPKPAEPESSVEIFVEKKSVSVGCQTVKKDLAKSSVAVEAKVSCKDAQVQATAPTYMHTSTQFEPISEVELRPMFPKPTYILENAVVEPFLENRLAKDPYALASAATSTDVQPPAELIKYLRQLVLDMKRESELASVTPGQQRTPVQPSGASEISLTDQLNSLKKKVEELSSVKKPSKKKTTMAQRVQNRVDREVEKRLAALQSPDQPSGTT